MTQFKALILIFLAFTTSSTFAQIAKGNYSVNGNVGLTANLQKNESYQNLTTAAVINPSVGKFITDKWFVSLQPRLSASTTRFGFGKLNASSQVNQRLNSQTLGLGINARYYFMNDKNTRFFGLIGLDASRNQYAIEGTFGGDAQSKSTQTSYQIGVGADIFLNSEVALEPTFSYTNYATQFTQTGFAASPASGDNKYDLFSLTIQFNNFLNLSLKTDSKETPQYIGKNRQIVGGQANFSHTKSASEKSTYYTLNPQFGQFITPRVLLKGALTVLGDVDFPKSTAVNTTLAARYYWPIRKRFFIYPELSVNYLTGSNIQSVVLGNDIGFPNTLTTGLTIGGSYFLSKNLAIDMTFSQTRLYFGESTRQYITTSLGIGTIGLLYFIK